MELQMNNAHSSRFLNCMLILFLCGAIVFLLGFFPISSHSLERFVNNDNRPTQLDGISITPPAQVYAQTIVLLIDALRHDFPTSVSMPFAYGNCCGFLKLEVSTPTVTMPRLKSLTTGTVSDFIDIVLNIGHVEQLSDSLLHRLRERGDVLVFAGDRTWVNLFPKKFQRQTANKDSFFVNDFYEGDTNVTKVLTAEVQQDDWTLMILHYLGLDHIGHVEGTESKKIPAKLKEMDQAIHQIYKAKHFHKQLLLVTGDHGMRDGGGHGGSTGGEIYVPLLIFRENCTLKSSIPKSNKYNQIDLAPTLAILLSIEIPTVSVGCLIPELLQELSLEDQLYAYYYNTLHLIRKAKVQFGDFSLAAEDYTTWFAEAKAAHKQFLDSKRSKRVQNAFLFEKAKLEYMRTSREISGQLSDSLVHFDYGLISIGLALTTLVVIYTLTVFITTHTTEASKLSYNTKLLVLTFVIALCINVCFHYWQYIEIRKIFYSGLLLLPIAAIVYIALMLAKMLHESFAKTGTFTRRHKSILPWPLFACLAFQTLSLGSSSFIEEEHLTWHYLGTSVLILLCAQVFRGQLRQTQRYIGYKNLLQQLWQMRFTLLLLVGLTLLRVVSRTNVIINSANNKLWLSAICASGLTLIFFWICRNAARAQLACCFLALLSVYCYHGLNGKVHFLLIHQNGNIAVLIVFWFAVCAATCTGFRHSTSKNGYLPQKSAERLISYLQTCVMSIVLISALLHRPQNVILLPGLIFTLHETYKLCDFLLVTRSRKGYTYAVLQKTICTIMVANMYYFYQGNSNSLATIDLNPGYIGQSSYNPFIVGIFVTLNMYSAPISAFLYLAINVLRSASPNDSAAVKREDVLAQPQNSSDSVWLVMYFYTIATLLPVATYLWLLVFFRYHLFIYSVFAPKALYECYRVVVFYFVLILTNINLLICK